MVVKPKAAGAKTGGRLTFRRVKKGANLSRKQIFEAQRKIWKEKEKKVQEAQLEAKRKKVADIKKQRNKRVNRAFERSTLYAVQEGLTSAIEMLGQKVSPLALFMSASTAVSKAPDQRHIPYMLSIMAACAPQLSQGVLLRLLDQSFALCDQLVAEYGATNGLVTAKAHKLAVSLLLAVEEPTTAVLQKFERLEPSKLQTEAVKLFLTGYRKILEVNALYSTTNGNGAGATASTPYKDPQTALYTLNQRQRFFTEGVPMFVSLCVRNLTDAPAAVLTAIMSELNSLFSRSLSPYIVESREGQEMINDLLSNQLLSLLKPVYQQCWAMSLELLVTLFGRLAYLKRVQKPPQEAIALDDPSAASSPRVACYVPLAVRLPAVPFLMRVLNKLRCMDDGSLNSKVERALVAVGNCMYVKEFLQVLSFNPQAAYEAEMSTAEDADDLVAQLWSTSYLTSVLRRIAAHDSLSFFVTDFFPCIQFCSKMAVEAERSQRVEEYTRWSALLIQYWRIGVGFAHYPVEVTNDAFREFAKQLVGLLSTPTFVDTSATALHVLCDGYYTLSQTEQDDDDEELPAEEAAAEKLEGDMREGGHRGAHRRLRKDALEEDLYYLSLNDPGWNPHRYHNISQDYAKHVCQDLFAKYSANIMPKLCNVFEGHNSTAVLLAIQSFSKVCQPAVMTTILNGILQVGSHIAAAAAEGQALKDGKVKAGNAPLTSKRRMILDIACAVVAQLPPEHVTTLFQDIIEPVLMDPAPESRLLQKKAYKLLFSMFEYRIKDIFPLFRRVVGILSVGRQHVTVSGMKMRIRCLSWAIDACKIYHPEELVATIRLLIAEVVLFSREHSSETRTMAMEVLEKMQRYMEGAGAPRNALLHMIVAGVSGKTPNMMSGAVVCMSKIVYLTHQSLAESDLNSSVGLGFKLMGSAMPEVRGAAAIFARMALKLAKRSPPVLAAVEKALPSLLYAIALVTSQTHVSSNTRMQMRVLLEKCIKRFGYEKIDPMFPLGSKNFLRYAQKMMKREEKKADQELKKRKEKQQNEFDSLFLGVTMNAGREEAAEEDLLETGALTSFVAKHAAPVFQGFGSAAGGLGGAGDEKDEYDDMYLDFQQDGKLRIITMDEKKVEDAVRHRQVMADRLLRRSGGLVDGDAVNDAQSRPGKRSRTAEDEDFENDELVLRYGGRVSSEAANKAAEAYKAGGGKGQVGPSALQIARLRDQKSVAREVKRARVEEDIRKGDEFRGKGEGDVRRGATEPFAYVPLNRRYMNRRHARHALHRFEVVASKHLKGEKAKTAREAKQ